MKEDMSDFQLSFYKMTFMIL